MFRNERLASKQDHAWFGLGSVGEELRKVQVVCHKYELMIACVSANTGIRRCDRSQSRPVQCMVTLGSQTLNPTRCQVHVDQQTHPLAGDADLTALGQTRGESQRFADILLFQIWEVRQQVVDGTPRRNRLDNHSNGHPHATNARLTPHYCWIDGDSLEFLHVNMISQQSSPNCTKTPAFKRLISATISRMMLPNPSVRRQ
jgi:hypothetical protein